MNRVAYKVHQSIRDVKEMLNTLLPEHTVLVHALKEDTDRLQQKLSTAGYENVYSLCNGTYRSHLKCKGDRYMKKVFVFVSIFFCCFLYNVKEGFAASPMKPSF